MAFPLSRYVLIKDRYCLCYLGWNEDHVRHAILARAAIESALPELQVYLSFRDHCCVDLCEGQPRIIPLSSLKDSHKDMAHVRELKAGAGENPVVAFLRDSGIPVPAGIT